MIKCVIAPERLIGLWMLSAVLLVLPACRSTNRVLEIHTDPPGADIWINGVKQASKTPVRYPFVHYGRFEVRVEKQGYESLAKDVAIPTPYEARPGIDLITEHTVPIRVVTRTLTLRPHQTGAADPRVKAHLRAAEAFRAQSMKAANEAAARVPPLDPK